MSTAALLLAAVTATGGPVAPVAQSWGGFTVTYERLGGNRYREASVDPGGRTRVIRTVRVVDRKAAPYRRVRPVDRAESWWPNGRRQALLERVPGGRSYLLWTTDGRLFVTAELGWNGRIHGLPFHDAAARERLHACPEGQARWFEGPSGWMGVHPALSRLDAPIRTGCGHPARGQILAWHPNGRLAAEWLARPKGVALKAWDDEGRVEAALVVEGEEGRVTCFFPSGRRAADGEVRRTEDPEAPLKAVGRWRWWTGDGGVEHEIEHWEVENGATVPRCLAAAEAAALGR